MSGPKLLETFFTERAGINAVASMANRMHCAWRETTHGDVGIDGQLELFMDTGEATNFIVFAQVKSGGSYFDWKDGVTLFRPDQRHRDYWRACPLPVLLLLHDPASGLVFWQDARRYLRSPEGEHSKSIPVPANQVFSPEQRRHIFMSCGPEPKALQATVDLADYFIRNRHPDAGFPVSFADLYLLGVVDVGFQLFFSMSLVMDVVEFNIAHAQSEFGWGLGELEYRFLDSYVRCLVEQRLVNLDFTAYLNTWADREMVPTFIVPFTDRGRELLRRLQTAALQAIGEAGQSVVRERLVRLSEIGMDIDRFVAVAEFQRIHSERAEAAREAN